MPTNRRRRPPRQRAGAGEMDSPRTRYLLFSGDDWPTLPGDPLGDEELEAAWELLRHELMDRLASGRGLIDDRPVMSVSEFTITRPRGAGPGFRPWAWWRFDAPEPRSERESSLDYLDRHDLLAADERQVLRR